MITIQQVELGVLGPLQVRQTHVSALRRALGDGLVLTQGTGWTVSTAELDATRYRTAATLGRDAMSSGDVSEAVGRFDEALGLWRGTPELPDSRRGRSERIRWAEDHAALVEDRADALLATGRAAELIGELEWRMVDVFPATKIALGRRDVHARENAATSSGSWAPASP